VIQPESNSSSCEAGFAAPQHQGKIASNRDFG
jgi:hypothetical protein